jgi:hypothetical protein
VAQGTDTQQLERLFGILGWAVRTASSFLWPEGRGKAIAKLPASFDTAVDTAVLPDLTSASQRNKHDRRT